MASRGTSCYSCPLQFGGGRPASFKADEPAGIVGRVDDEDEGVVERVVLQLAALVGEVDAQVQPAVGERRTVGIEAKRERACAVGPAELRGRHGAAGDEDRRVVAELPAEARRSDLALSGDLERDREALAPEELRPLA